MVNMMTKPTNEQRLAALDEILEERFCGSHWGIDPVRLRDNIKEAEEDGDDTVYMKWPSQYEYELPLDLARIIQVKLRLRWRG